MEVIGVLFVCWIAWFIVSSLMKAGARTVSAAAKTATGKGTFSENMNSEFTTMGEFQIRFTDIRLGENEDGARAKAIEGTGLFPVGRPCRVGFVTSVFDSTGEDYEPVIAAIESFQEPTTVAYQYRIDVGQVSYDEGYPRWARVGLVIPEILNPPYGGTREITAALWMIDLDNPPASRNGFIDAEDDGLIWMRSLSFEHIFDEKGYQEAAEHRDESQSIAVKLAMAVAMADGSLDDTEGNVLKEWIVRTVSSFTDEKQEALKKLYNGAMREAYADAKADNLSLTALTERLNEIAEKTTKYEVVELCFDVMAADGAADSQELLTIRKVAEALELDFDEIEKMRDQRIVGLDSGISNQASIEEFLGIEPDWDIDQIKKHLRVEFQKWNNRLNTLQEGTERENAQKTLDAIAGARKKYG